MTSSLPGMPMVFRLLCVLSMLLALAGCTAAGRSDRAAARGCTTGPITFDAATAKARIVATAEEAWTWWGERTVYRRSDRTVIELAGGPWEHEREAFRPLAEYWCAVQPPRDFWREASRDAGTAAPAGTDGMVRPEVFAATRIGHAPFADAWSAAFVSWVMASAGVPDALFPRAPAHWTYASALIRRARGGRGSPDGALAFMPHAVGAYRPRPADLICATRDGPPLRSFAALPERFQRMHCDIVVATDRTCPSGVGERCLAAVGGNVAQAVAETLVPLDRAGRIVLQPGGRDWIVIFENRLDRASAHATAAPPT